MGYHKKCIIYKKRQTIYSESAELVTTCARRLTGVIASHHKLTCDDSVRSRLIKAYMHVLCLKIPIDSRVTLEKKYNIRD